MTQEQFASLKAGDKVVLSNIPRALLYTVDRVMEIPRRDGTEIQVFLTNGNWYSSYSVSTVEGLELDTQ